VLPPSGAAPSDKRPRIRPSPISRGDGRPLLPPISGDRAALGSRAAIAPHLLRPEALVMVGLSRSVSAAIFHISWKAHRHIFVTRSAPLQISPTALRAWNHKLLWDVIWLTS
jgi:hypothetical protein